MYFLSTFVAVVFVMCYQHASASTIFFQVNPTTIFPVLTKSLKLRCSVEVGLSANLAHRRDELAAYVQNATNPIPPTTHSSPATHVNTTHRPLTTHRPIITEADVSHIMSIIVTRLDRATGKLQTVARVSPYDPPSASVDLDNIKVEGNTDASPIAREKGYLEVTWEYPAEAQSAEYFCDIYGLDATLHPVSLNAQTRVLSSQVTVSELAGFVAQNQRYVTELQASLTHVTAQLSKLQTESQTEIRALNNTIGSLENRTEDMQAQNIQTGAIDCLNTFIPFPKPYQRTPIVFISIFDFQPANYNFNLVVTIQNVNTTGFTPLCTRTSITVRNILWIAIDN